MIIYTVEITTLEIELSLINCVKSQYCLHISAELKYKMTEKSKYKAKIKQVNI